MFERTFDLDGIAIRSGGTGRTVEAYAAIFDVEVDICDSQGRYRERIAPTAFDESLRTNPNPPVFYHHGRTLQGTPSESGSMPVGRCIECRADGRGLLTITEYARTPRAEELLELIKDGAITAQSFAGRFEESVPQLPHYDGQTVTRTKISLTEYGPTPLPAYADAAIVGVRGGVRTQSPPQSVRLQWLRWKARRRHTSP